MSNYSDRLPSVLPMADWQEQIEWQGAEPVRQAGQQSSEPII
jgi:hypothetical protein